MFRDKGFKYGFRASGLGIRVIDWVTFWGAVRIVKSDVWN